eukprot:9043567-Ditylum_brightwellii.AAC.1
MQDRELWDVADCPRGCTEEMRTPNHVIQCTKANRLWGKVKNILIKWGYINKAKLGLISTLIEGMSQWRNNEESQLHNNIDHTTHIAFLKQKRIGWD